MMILQAKEVQHEVLPELRDRAHEVFERNMWSHSIFRPGGPQY